MNGAVLALAASGAWGVSDFLGGVRTRSINLPAVLLLSQLAGLPVVLGALALRGQRLELAGVGAGAVVQAALAGAAGVTSLGCLYLVMARGRVWIVAPISAVAAALPVLVGLAHGEHLTLRTGGGVLLALLGALGVGLPARVGSVGQVGSVGRRRPLLDPWSVLAATASAVGAALFFVLIRAASTGEDPALMTLTCRVSGAALVGAWALGQWPQLGSARRAGPLALAAIAVVGVGDAVAELCFATASTRAPLSVVAPLASLYPAVAVVLALVVVRERLSRLGSAAMVCALAGVGLLA
jgi:drug/metabolite transporter (DMT)-like permease